MSELEIKLVRIADSALILGPSRVIESLDGTRIDVLQYHEFLPDASKFEERRRELSVNRDVLVPALPEGWKDYEWSEENQPKVNRGNVKYFS